MSESKVVFQDGDQIRAIRGEIISEDKHFITLSRRDGQMQIGKKYILKIEKGIK